jgi:flagellin
MSSINTNLSAMTALQSLKTTQNSMNKTQNQISTGLRVGEASHNASYWSISTQMKSDNGALSAVKDAIGQSKAMINTFTTANDKVLTYLNKMKDSLVAASQPGADMTAIQGEWDANKEALLSTAASAQFNGQNWLATDATDVKLVVSYDAENAKVSKADIDLTKVALFGAPASAGADPDKAAGLLKDVFDAANDTLSATAAAGANGSLDDALVDVNAAIEAVRASSSLLGANKAMLETQEEFISALTDNITAGVSTFIDADMNEASTRYQALQTQQQLGVQALSMANQNSQMILKLFQ